MTQEETSVSDLGNSLKTLLANNVVFMFKAQSYHWNAEGPHFAELHRLFGKIYEDMIDTIDRTAEHIRALDEYCPGSLKRFGELATIEEDTKIPTASVMVTRLLSANQQMIDTLGNALSKAKIANNEGVINFLGERLESHAKWGWMLRATSKKDRA
jgi:starvation-inducible DNA-binding protein